MTITIAALAVPIIAMLVVADLERWIPWIAEQIVSHAARRFDSRNRQIKDEEYRANVQHAGSPFSMLLYAIFTYIKAPYRARELRGDIHDPEALNVERGSQRRILDPVNWQSDIDRSVAEYDRWYLAESSAIFAQARERVIAEVTEAMQVTDDFRTFNAASLIARPGAFFVARTCVSPPMTRDSFVSLSGASKNLVTTMERDGVTPANTRELRVQLQAMCDFICPLFDPLIFRWLREGRAPTAGERDGAAMVIAERLVPAFYMSAFRNAQEARQRKLVRVYLEEKGFQESFARPFMMPPGTFSFGRNGHVVREDGEPENLPVDYVVGGLRRVSVRRAVASGLRRDEVCRQFHQCDEAQQGWVPQARSAQTRAWRSSGVATSTLRLLRSPLPRSRGCGWDQLGVGSSTQRPRALFWGQVSVGLPSQGAGTVGSTDCPETERAPRLSIATRYSDPRVSALPDQSVARRIAETLVRTGAVAFRTEPFFRLTSGTESPVYVDNRQLLGYVAERQEVLDAFLQLIAAQPTPEAIAGTATAGIPWGAWLADRLSLPFVYVRSQAKAWGKESAVEGTAPTGARVLVIEDLAFSAGSLADAAENLRAAGFLVEDALTIASYDMPSAQARLESLGLRHMTLTTIDEALAAAGRAGSLNEGQVSVVEAWLHDSRTTGD